MDARVLVRRSALGWWCCASLLLGLWAGAGCGTTKWSDTPRTATEQLLISDAIDRAVSRIDFRALAGKEVYLDATPVQRATDSAYLVSTLRQHMLASGCILRDKREDADYVVEVRAGAVGTDRSELFFGVPATKIPSVVPVPGVPNSIPELKIITRNEQRGVAKIALFAYNQHTGRPVWQSGVIPVESKAKDLWVLGAGPFQQGTIYDGTNFAGDRINIPLIDLDSSDRYSQLSVTEEAFFAEPGAEPDSPSGKKPETQLAGGKQKTQPAKPNASTSPGATGGKVVQASHTAPAGAQPKPPSGKNADPKKQAPGDQHRPPAASGAKPAADESSRKPAAPAHPPQSTRADTSPENDQGHTPSRPPVGARDDRIDSSNAPQGSELKIPALLPDPPADARLLSGPELAPNPPDVGALGPEATWLRPLHQAFSPDSSTPTATADSPEETGPEKPASEDHLEQ